MEEFVTRFFENLGLKLHGPMKFRFVIQPLMSLIFAIKAGMRDSKTGSVPYLWGLFFQKGERKELVTEGWKDVGKIFLIAIIMDIIFQLIVLKTIYPLETILTAFLLAFIPYLIFRGIINRIFSFLKLKKSGQQ